MSSSCCSPECGIRARRLRRRLERLRDRGGTDDALLKAFSALQRLSDRCEGAECPGRNTERPGLNAERPGLNAERPGMNTERARMNTERPALNAEHPGMNAEHPGRNAEHPALNTERPGMNAERPGINTERPGRNTERPTQNAEPAECLVLYTQALLDVTYCEESRLVEAEFPGDDSLQTVRDLVQLLSELERHPQNVALNAEVQECLHWRRGALLYMYCHTVGERERWEPRQPEAFHQCLQDGVHYLLKMLHTRSPVQLDDEVLFQDINTAALLEKGIFSDVHVLALMYCGEMCYWAQRYCRAAAPTSPSRADPETPRQNLPFRDIGEKVLDTYVGVCEGPLRGQGWSTDNAKKILQYLRGDV